AAKRTHPGNGPRGFGDIPSSTAKSITFPSGKVANKQEILRLNIRFLNDLARDVDFRYRILSMTSSEWRFSSVRLKINAWAFRNAAVLSLSAWVQRWRTSDEFEANSRPRRAAVESIDYRSSNLITTKPRQRGRGSGDS